MLKHFDRRLYHAVLRKLSQYDNIIFICQRTAIQGNIVTVLLRSPKMTRMSQQLLTVWRASSFQKYHSKSHLNNARLEDILIFISTVGDAMVAS